MLLLLLFLLVLVQVVVVVMVVRLPVFPRLGVEEALLAPAPEPCSVVPSPAGGVSAAGLVIHHAVVALARGPLRPRRPPQLAEVALLRPLAVPSGRYRRCTSRRG